MSNELKPGEESYSGMDGLKLLRFIKTNTGAPIADWPFTEPAEGWRLHYKILDPGQTGLRFCCIEWGASSEHGDEYSVAFEGVAYFDGIRHLHFGGTEGGYFHCPSLPRLTKCLEALRALEVEHCPEAYDLSAAEEVRRG